MTQATSPLQPVETLREQLIREGNIIPAENLKSNIKSTLEKIETLILKYKDIVNNRDLFYSARNFFAKANELIDDDAKKLVSSVYAYLSLRKISIALKLLSREKRNYLHCAMVSFFHLKKIRKIRLKFGRKKILC